MVDSLKFEKKRLRRSESFLGLHFDFHARQTDRDIGTRPIESTLDKLLKRVRPDYVQCDCKGHAGWSSYPTKIGYPAPNQRRDLLKSWRKVTARHGVALFMHFSGVFDTEAIRRHPTWARVTEKGRRDPNNTSVFGPYVDAHLIPQLRELREEYGVDGYWIDGDCWAACQDYSKAVLRDFQRETGIRSVPRQAGDPRFFAFTEYCREGFRRYLRRYVDELHRLCPGVQVASNWAYSSFMPEPVSARVDFLSGDYTLNDSVNSARLEGRCLMHQGLPWDLMAWSFSAVFAENDKSSTKPVAQLQREAAAVLALGGGFQMYFTQRRDGSVRAQHIGLTEKIASFCRARQTLCHQARSIPQVALLFSGSAFYRTAPRLFGAWGGELHPLAGTLNALLNNQYSVDVLSEHHLKGQMQKFPLLVLPEWGYLDSAFKEEMLAYVRQGGKLLVIGAKAAPLFSREMGLRLKGETETRARWLETSGEMAGIFGPGVKIKPGPKTRVLTQWYERDDAESTAHLAAVSRKLGRGEIVLLPIDFGMRYRFQRTSQARQVLGALVKHLFPEPMVEINGSHEIDVCLMEKDGTVRINLLNTSGPHDNLACYTFDEVAPLGPIEVTIRLPKRPKRLLLQPENHSLAFRWSGGKAHTVVPRLDIHAVVEIVS